jgi:hypothetical protein
MSPSKVLEQFIKSHMPKTDALEQFHWTPQPAAEELVRDILEEYLAGNKAAAKLRDRMRDETGTRFLDWIDEISIGRGQIDLARLEAAGFTNLDGEVYAHEGGIFPKLRLVDNGAITVMLKVESASDFAAANGESIELIGEPGNRVRLAVVNRNLRLIERHGYRGALEPWQKTDDKLLRIAMRHAETFRLRQREFDDDVTGFDHAERLIDAAIKDIGVDWTCDLFFAAEREFWQRRNSAAQFQKARQDRLGLGWANHDHHTYRSSRRHFARLIQLLENLGFVCRERFYAGADAGWGAQVLEQPNAGVIIFADVDLSPDELFNDFAHESLPERQHLGTVGLWCGLHGEAFLQAGMHHLECQFDFAALKQQMESTAGIKVMKPFTDFPYLKQAFTEGERWPVAEKRIAALLVNGKITPDQAAQFRQHGAIGSHLENLERNEGFKGFNQKGISEIISATDPRAHH